MTSCHQALYMLWSLLLTIHVIYGQQHIDRKCNPSLLHRYEDCPKGYCCVRDEFLPTYVFCRKIGQVDENCTTRDSDSECPCAEGLVCKANIVSSFVSLYGRCHNSSNDATTTTTTATTTPLPTTTPPPSTTTPPPSTTTTPSPAISTTTKPPMTDTASPITTNAAVSSTSRTSSRPMQTGATTSSSDSNGVPGNAMTSTSGITSGRRRRDHPTHPRRLTHPTHPTHPTHTTPPHFTKPIEVHLPIIG